MATAHSAIQLTDAQRARVLAHLEELLSSSAFSGSRRRQAFLRYVVEETLAGRGQAIKESNIAVDVFERDVDFDAQSESIVRVTGGDVRKRLSQFYSSGLYSEVHIELPLGSYQPAIQFLTPSPALDSPPLEVANARPIPTPWRWHRIVWATVGLTAAAVLTLASSALHTKSPLDHLWEPFVSNSEPVVISLAVASALAVPEPAKWLPLKPNTSIPTESLLEMDSAYVGSGGALGAARFAERLTERSQHFVVKLSTDVSFADMKNAPTIMVGPSRWTRELHAKTRIRLVTEGFGYKIVDSRNDHSWGLPGNHSDRVEGYCLVTRLLNSESGKPVMLVVGLDDRNTQAGVEFLSDPTKFAQFANITPNWEKKNFQVVLHSTIHGSSAGSLAVVASYVW